MIEVDPTMLEIGTMGQDSNRLDQMVIKDVAPTRLVSALDVIAFVHNVRKCGRQTRSPWLDPEITYESFMAMLREYKIEMKTSVVEKLITIMEGRGRLFSHPDGDAIKTVVKRLELPGEKFNKMYHLFEQYSSEVPDDNDHEE